jgi:hypothetical protein
MQTALIVSLRAMHQPRKSAPIYLTAGHFTMFRRLFQALAIHDRDPRIAGLAGRLRDCRKGAQRR